MKRWASAVLSVVLLSGAYGPEIRYFSNVRDVSVSKPDKQNYLVIDEEIWEHARPELADIRLYDGVTQVPYVLQEQKRTSTTVERPAKILNLGRVAITRSSTLRCWASSNTTVFVCRSMRKTLSQQRCCSEGTRLSAALAPS